MDGPSSTHDHSAPRDAEPAPPRSALAVAISDAASSTWRLPVIRREPNGVLLIVAMLAADAAFMVHRTVEAAAHRASPWWRCDAESHPGGAGRPEDPVLDLAEPDLLHAVRAAVGVGRRAARLPDVADRFFGRQLVDAILDIPIVLPPLVVGLSLLILFQSRRSAGFARQIVYQVPAVILAQFAVACAFAVRTMRATFDQIDPRREQVALTLGCTRPQAFGLVVLPEAGGAS